VTFEIDPALVTGFVLALVRASAWVMVSPPFSTRGIPARVKIGLAAALALAAAPHVAGGGGELPLATGAFVGAVVTQVVMGVLLGFMTLVLFSAVQAAGSLIDLFAGYSIATVYDPLSDTSTAVFGRFYNLVALTLLFATGAHLLLVRGFLTSFDAPALAMGDLGEVGRVLSHDLGVFFVAAVEIAVPVVAVLFMTEIALGLLARAAPQMNVFNLGFAARVVVALGFAALTLPLVGPALHNLVDLALRQGAGLG